MGKLQATINKCGVWYGSQGEENLLFLFIFLEWNGLSDQDLGSLVNLIQVI